MFGAGGNKIDKDYSKFSLTFFVCDKLQGDFHVKLNGW